MKQLFTFLLLLVCLRAEAREEGVTVRGGGDEVGLEFTDALHSALALIRELYPDLQAEIEPHKLAELAEEAHVYVTDEPLLVPAGSGTQESVAVNEPATNRIWIHRARWKGTTNRRFRQAIALHEYLSLRGAEGTGAYPISGEFLKKFRLRNDAEIFISGQDAPAPYKSVRLSCEELIDYRDVTNGKTHRHNNFSLVALATWRLFGKSYYLNYSFGNEPKGRLGTNLMGISVSREVEKDDRGIVTEISGRGLVRSAEGKVMEHVHEKEYAYSENTVNGVSRRYAWKKGRRGAHTSTTRESILPDGSLHQSTQHHNYVKAHPLEVTSSRNDCTATLLDSENWIAVTGDPTIAMDIEKLNARAINVEQANRAYRDCGEGDCGALKKEVDRQVKNFEAAFNQVFDARKVKLKGKRFVPPKAGTAAVPAARRPAPKARAAARPARPAAVATAPTYIDGPGGVPVLRMPGQSLRLTPSEEAALRALDEYKKRSR